MKPLALVLLLASSTLLAADPIPLPPEMLCVKVKGIEGRIYCNGHFDYSTDPLDLVIAITRNTVFQIGFEAANAYYPPPLTAQQEKQRELGRKVMEAAPYLCFPELGDPVTKNTKAVAYCSSSAGKGIIDPWDPAVFETKATGKGGCSDLMIVYLRPAK